MQLLFFTYELQVAAQFEKRKKKESASHSIALMLPTLLMEESSKWNNILSLFYPFIAHITDEGRKYMTK